MGKYRFWDREETLYAPDGSEWTKEKILQQYGWMNSPDAKVIVSKPPISMAVFMEYTLTLESYKRNGLKLAEGLSDVEILDAMSDFEDRPAPLVASVEERTAAALEALVMLGMPDIAEEE